MFILHYAKIEFGKHINIAYGNWFSAGEKITLEDVVELGPKSIFASINHILK